MSTERHRAAWWWRISFSALAIVSVVTRNIAGAVCLVAITIAYYSEGENDG